MKPATEHASGQPGAYDPNPVDISNFIEAMFRHAKVGTYVSLRGFPNNDGKNGRPLFIEGVAVQEGNYANIFRRAVSLAKQAAKERGVFCPPIATFTNRDHARQTDLAQGLALSVEVDQGDTITAAERLCELLGPFTVAVGSGGEWQAADGTEFPRLHLHWRLTTPTETTEQHHRLRAARALACALAGGDPTAKSVVHPLRWPGSWHLKGRPRLAEIDVLNPDAEIDLDAVAAIPNEDEHWLAWNNIMGLALYAATGGSTEGYEIWLRWSRKSSKHNDDDCHKRWKDYCNCPPDHVGAGTIFFWAKKAGWEWPTGEIGNGLLLLDPEIPMASARALVRRDYMDRDTRTLHHQQGVFYHWVGTHYEELPDEEVLAHVWRFLDGAKGRSKDQVVPFSPNKARVANVIEALGAETQLRMQWQPPVMLDNADDPFAREVLACRNGLLHLPTRTIYKLNPLYFNLNALDYDYDLRAPKPHEWQKFMKSL